jgi:hypothetical protein
VCLKGSPERFTARSTWPRSGPYKRGGCKKSKMSHAARERMEPGFGICAKVAAAIRSRIRCWSTKHRFRTPGIGTPKRVSPVRRRWHRWLGDFPTVQRPAAEIPSAGAPSSGASAVQMVSLQLRPHEWRAHRWYQHGVTKKQHDAVATRPPTPPAGSET